MMYNALWHIQAKSDILKRNRRAAATAHRHIRGYLSTTADINLSIQGIGHHRITTRTGDRGTWGWRQQVVED
jgi:hypothetical protein